MNEVPPFVFFFLAALLVLVTRGHLRKLILLAAPVVAGLHIWLNIEAGTSTSLQVLNVDLILMRADKLSLIFGYLFCLAGFLA
ncbi:MAG: Na(+)/H(+) antiporter subunit D, partial [Rhizobiales bacterium]|nr:Na(+)/H(+) antiporter subunit D [Hyphomicrobiales bacterium]